MFGVSTKTGYKWWQRFEQEGMPGLLDRSRPSHSHPNATAEDMVTLVIGAQLMILHKSKARLIRCSNVLQFSGLVVVDEGRRAPFTELLPNRPNVG
jgi:hypothetical protein